MERGLTSGLGAQLTHEHGFYISLVERTDRLHVHVISEIINDFNTRVLIHCRVFSSRHRGDGVTGLLLSALWGLDYWSAGNGSVRTLCVSSARTLQSVSGEVHCSPQITIITLSRFPHSDAKERCHSMWRCIMINTHSSRLLPPWISVHITYHFSRDNISQQLLLFSVLHPQRINQTLLFMSFCDLLEVMQFYFFIFICSFNSLANPP